MPRHAHPDPLNPMISDVGNDLLFTQPCKCTSYFSSIPPKGPAKVADISDTDQGPIQPFPIIEILIYYLLHSMNCNNLPNQYAFFIGFAQYKYKYRWNKLVGR